jgi:hypothetical protein
MMEACFMGDQCLYVTLFHNKEHKVYCFKYSILKKKIIENSLTHFMLEKTNGS